jgi:hypothetical protein
MAKFVHYLLRFLEAVLALTFASEGISLVVQAFADSTQRYESLSVALGLFFSAWALTAYALDMQGPFNLRKRNIGKAHDA